MRAIKYSIDQKEEALAIARRRIEMAYRLSRQDDFPGARLLPEWIGSLAEVICRDAYPSLELGGPDAIKGDDASFIEFRNCGYLIEVKCSQSHQARKGEYLPLNVAKYYRRRMDYDILYGYFMKKHPEETNKIWELGYVWIEDVDPNNVVKMVYAPAIAIPWTAFKPIKELEL